MDKFFELFFNSVKEGNWSVMLLIVCITVIFRIKNIFEFLDDRLSTKENFLFKMLNVSSDLKISTDLVVEELNRLIFYKITKIHADVFLRERIKQIIKKSNGEISLSQITRVRQFISQRNDASFLKLGLFEKIGCVLYGIFAVIFCAYGIIFLVIVTASDTTLSKLQLVTLCALATVIFLFGAYFLSFVVEYKIAKEMQKTIQKKNF